MVTGDNEPHAFMRATYGDSIAKAEKKAKDLRNSKRQSDIAGRRTKLREQLQTSSLVSDSPREIWIETLGVNLIEEVKEDHEEQDLDAGRSNLEAPKEDTAFFK